MQKALYPLLNLRWTQDELGTYSHAGSLAADDGGKDGASKDKGYAPCDLTIVRVRNDSSHETYAESIEPVLWADGTVDYMNFTFMHDNYVNGNTYKGAVIQQGAYFYDEGGFGYGRIDKFGWHMHLSVGRGKSPAYQVQNRYGTWVTPGEVHIYDALFVSRDTTILNGRGHNWRRTEDSLLTPVGNQGGGEAAGSFSPYNVRPLYKLNVRKGPGLDRAKTGLFALTKYLYTVKEVSGSWGRTPIGWIYLPYTRKA